MFWKKKQQKAGPVSAKATEGMAAAEKKAEAPKQARIEKLAGPTRIPGIVGKQLTGEYKMSADLVALLKAVTRRKPGAERTSEIRIYDEAEAEASGIKVKDYTSIDKHPEIVLYEGWFDESSKKAQLEEKKKVNYDTPLFSEAEILQKIEALKEPGSTVFFYQARGPAAGGPLGRGAAIVELNPSQAAKKGKKYIIYTANVVGTEPAGNKQRLFDSDKPKEVAKWIKEAHQKRMY